MKRVVSRSLSRCARLTVLALVLAGSLPAQYIPRSEFGDPIYRRRGTIDSNNIRTTIFNFGLSGRTGLGQGIPYEWPKNSGRDYLDLKGMFVGGAVLDTSGKPIHIVSVPAFRQNQTTGGDWNFNPVPSYLSSASLQIARSDDPTTWPTEWPDKMNDSVDP